MKKNYELVEVTVISLGNEDVITASFASRSSMSDFLNNGDFNLGALNTQDLG